MPESAKQHPVPGRPSSQTPPLEEPTEPAEPLPPKLDPYLCEQMAAGLGLPAPQGPRSLPEVPPSPALSQVGQTWPVKGRIIGIIAGKDSNLKTLESVRNQVLDSDMVPLVIAPAGGVLGNGAGQATVQRTFATARSVNSTRCCSPESPGPGPTPTAHATPRPATAGTGPRTCWRRPEFPRRPRAWWLAMTRRRTSPPPSGCSASIASGTASRYPRRPEPWRQPRVFPGAGPNPEG